MAASISMIGLITWRTPKGTMSLRNTAASSPTGTATANEPIVTYAEPASSAKAPKIAVGDRSGRHSVLVKNSSRPCCWKNGYASRRMNTKISSTASTELHVMASNNPDPSRLAM